MIWLTNLTKLNYKLTFDSRNFGKLKTTETKWKYYFIFILNYIKTSKSRESKKIIEYFLHNYFIILNEMMGQDQYYS